eukprot:scaffold139_cov325-Pavlova_lutheri.AAC.4
MERDTLAPSVLGPTQAFEEPISVRTMHGGMSVVPIGTRLGDRPDGPSFRSDIMIRWTVLRSSARV